MFLTLDDISMLLNGCPELTRNFLRREANKAAHAVAKYTVSKLMDCMLWSYVKLYMLV